MFDYIVLIKGKKVNIQYKELLCLNWMEAKKRAIKKLCGWSSGFGCVNWDNVTVRKCRKKGDKKF